MTDEVLRNLPSEEELLEEFQEKNRGKSIARGFLAFFLVMLVLSFLLPGTGVIDIFQGYLESARVDEQGAVAFDEGTVLFTKEALKELRNLYIQNQRTEMKVCLFGAIEGSTYKVNKLLVPHIFDASVFHVRAARCDPEAIITLHSHPQERCLLSAQDIQTHREIQKTNPDVLSAVMCSLDRFSFYSE